MIHSLQIDKHVAGIHDFLSFQRPWPTLCSIYKLEVCLIHIYENIFLIRNTHGF